MIQGTYRAAPLVIQKTFEECHSSVLFVCFFTCLDSHVKPVLRRRERTFVLIRIRASGIIRLVEIENPHGIRRLMDISLKIKISASTVGFLTTCRIPKRHPQSIVGGIALERLERNGLAVYLESKFSPRK